MTNIVATGISGKLTTAEKAAIRTNIDVDKGIRDYQAYIDSLFAKATLDLNFVTNEHKVYEAFGPVNKLITDAITTARNSTATYQTPTGIATAAINTPRITFDAATGDALGLLAEEQRTNLLLHSQYTAASGETPPTGWVIGFNTGVTTTAASNRFTGAIRATHSGNVQREFYEQSVSLAATTTYTLSVYFAAGTSANNDVIRVGSADGVWQLAGLSVTSPGIYSITFTTIAGGAYSIRIGLGCSSGGTGTVIHETPQLEVGTAPTSYIPTTTAAMQRFADVISRAPTITNANAGSIFIGFDLASYDKASGNAATVVKLSDAANTGLRGFGLQVFNNDVSVRLRNATFSYNASLTVADSLQPIRALISYDNLTLKLLVCVNGVSAETNMPTAVDMTGFIESLILHGASAISGGTAAFSKTVKRCTYIPRSFTATEAQAITL